MKLLAILERPSGALEDIVIGADSGATVHDLAASIVAADPRDEYGGPEYAGPLALEVRATDGTHDVETFEGRDSLSDLALASGVQLRVVPEARVPRTVIGEIVVISGPDAGARHPLHRGTSTVGRDESCDVVLGDVTVSKRHARIHAAADRIEVIDLNSANGVLLDDALVPRADITAGQRITLGSSVILARLDGTAEPPSTRIQERKVTRTPRVEARFPARELESADLPGPPEKQPFPWLIMLMPLVAGAVLYAITRSATSLVFVAMSPLMMLGSWATGAGKRRGQLKEAIARFEDQLARLGARLDRERVAEADARRAEAPALVDIDGAVRAGGSLLWTRRPEHWSFLQVRLGTGEAPARITVKEPANRDRALAEHETRFDALVDAYRTVPDVPIVEDLAAAGALGVVGSPRYAASYVRGLVAQVAGLHAADEVVLAGVAGPRWAAELEAAKWLPHRAGAEQLLGASLGSSPQACRDVVARLEELIAARGGASPTRLGPLGDEDSALHHGARVGEGRGEAARAHLPAVVVLIGADAPIERSRLIQLTERAAGTGVHPVWLCESPADLPAACRTHVTFDEQAVATAHFVRLGSTVPGMQAEGFSAAQFRAFALALARLVDVGAVAQDESDLPTLVPLLDVVGRSLAEQPSAVIDRWVQNGSIVPAGLSAAPQGYKPQLRALVGEASGGALHLDLRTDGPHALVGGTTGSGKSEFLQGWVLAMAAEYSPQRVTFLFVDYKGGSAFADCVSLPHCVGLVTDLSPHLVRRALVSLRAELHHREELINLKRAKDVIELEKRGDPECPPALVLVIDEFAALVSEVPDFVDGVVDIAQRGRSLGIHLIMATQRPAGVIKDNLRANTNLRIALRMADESDSMDVIGSKASAQLPPELRGRGAVKSGPGRLTMFQAAYTGGHSFDEVAAPEPRIATVSFGPPEPWARPAAAAPPASTDRDERPTDQMRMVATMREAAGAARIAAPRRPWLDELPSLFALERVLGGPDTRLPFGVIDRPKRQAQEALVLDPDSDQNLVVFGASGSGKTGVLRALAIAAGHAADPVHVYALDAGGSGLAMLEAMPHVGSVIGTDDSERVVRLARMLRALVEERNVRYGALGAEDLSDYRAAADAPGEARVLVLVDGFASFRAEYEGVPGRAEAFAALQFVMQEGRAVGVHAVLTADRAATVSNSMMATVQKRLVLRLADADGYGGLGVPRDILGEDAPAGRGAIGTLECQVGVLGGIGNARELRDAIAAHAPTMPAAHRRPAAAIRALPADYGLDALPAEVDGRPVLALSDVALAPHPFEPTGGLLVAGGPETGRTSALLALAQSLRRWRPDVVLAHLCARRGELSRWAGWDATAVDAAGLASLDRWIDAAAAGGAPVALMVESVTDFAETATEKPLQAWLRRARMGELLLVAEVDPVDLTGYSGLKSELKSVRRGMVLRPETADGEGVLKTPFPRVDRGEFGPGRGLWASAGRVARIQMPRPLPPEREAAVVPPRPERAEAHATVESTPTPTPAPAPAPAASVPSWALAPGRE